MLTQKQIYDTALLQSSYDCACSPEDFLQDRNIVVLSKKDERARRYLKLPFILNLVYYGKNIVASVREDLKDETEAFLEGKKDNYSFFETPKITDLEKMLSPKGARVCYMAEYFLPDIASIPDISTDYETRMLYKEDFRDLYTDDWKNALCSERKELDIMGTGVYDGGKLVGFAACSMDCDEMWQIGIDVLPGYRKKGIASALVSKLALEILERDKVPFYCAAWSNIASVRTAINSGFRPAWMELTAKETDMVNNL